jgi:hypothetical protein
MTEPTPNLPLLRKVLEQITAAPETWDQSAWAATTPCGTAMCVAGHAAALTGHTFRFESDGKAGDTTDGRLISAVAIEELGLTLYESDELFDSRNGLADLQRIAGRIAARAGEVL